ncbi:vicilin-like seed storage protein At2g18540 isoform X1 [Alosa sapidissima]|uniref:vicilin-like seed storage protein At2g18540 isoform X1 n=2 Tax=Alosa sapidissima TaxID=34773 RepID=UPI001C095B99|nr:vicilin-like seed storage protein At2g18540 isoform X1 [Alosa sapidissima]
MKDTASLTPTEGIPQNLFVVPRFLDQKDLKVNMNDDTRYNRLEPKGVMQNLKKYLGSITKWKALFLVVFVSLFLILIIGWVKFTVCMRESAAMEKKALERENKLRQEAQKNLTEAIQNITAEAKKNITDCMNKSAEREKAALERERTQNITIQEMKEQIENITVMAEKRLNTTVKQMREEAANTLSEKVKGIRQEEEQKRTDLEKKIRGEEEQKRIDLEKKIREEEERKRIDLEKKIREEEEQKRLDLEKKIRDDEEKKIIDSENNIRKDEEKKRHDLQMENDRLQNEINMFKHKDRRPLCNTGHMTATVPYALGICLVFFFCYHLMDHS